MSPQLHPPPSPDVQKARFTTYIQTDFALFDSYSGRQGGKQVGWQAGGYAGRRVGIQKDRCPHKDTDKQTYTDIHRQTQTFKDKQTVEVEEGRQTNRKHFDPFFCMLLP